MTITAVASCRYSVASYNDGNGNRDTSQAGTARKGRGFYRQVEERLARLAKAAGDLGWGYGDTVTEVVSELRDHFGA